jgi:hypothetical protein
MSGNEFFYKDKDGKKQDASLHEPILAAGDEEAARKIGIEVARRAGVFAVLPVEPTQPVPFGADQSFVDSGAINTAAGELIDDPIARPVLTSR